MHDLILDGLNPAQLAAVTSSASVLQVLAPPGSGKTKTLTSRVAYLLSHHGYSPQNVICCTFTIKASRQMRERLAGLIGSELEAKLLLGTFHSICRRYLAVYGYLIGIAKGFGIADTSDSNAIIKRIVKRLKLSIDCKTARSKISHHKAKGKGLEDLPKTPQKKLEQQEFITVFHEYQSTLATSNLLDYDDLLLRCVDLLRAYPNCVANIEALLIDEFQDTNVVQFELMRLLASGKRRITIVGDPDQSIYGFRSAEIENLQRMKAYYPEAVVINLEENYRSSSAILKLAQRVIEQDNNRPNKRLKSTHAYGTVPVLRRLPNPYEEALWITGEVKRLVTLTGGLIQYLDVAVLLRSAYLSLLIEKSFTRSRIPYRIVGGQRFFDRAEIRLIVDYLRTISHPDNNSALLSIINIPSRKIGETTLAALAHLSETKRLTLWSALQKVLSGDLIPESRLSKPAEQELHKLVKLIRSANDKMKSMIPEHAPSQLISLVVSSLKLEDYLKTKYKDDFEDRLENIQELINHASEVASMPESTERLPDIQGVEQQVISGAEEVLAQFLANVVLSTETETSDPEDEPKSKVTISTIHSAKGLEWPVVFIPAVYEGSIPHSRAEDIDEERRLLYVAMTRSQALLTLTFPIMQPREEVESVLTQFLPSNTLSLLSKTGPLLTGKVISDIAGILRRPPPTQEDLTRGLQSLEAGESFADDVWPNDGTQRASTYQHEDNKGFGSGHNEAEMDDTSGIGFERKSNHSIATKPFHAPQKYHSFSHVSTTMNQASQFSVANLSLSFTTANHQLKTNNLTPDHTTDNKKQKQTQPKLGRTSNQQSNLSTFLMGKSRKTGLEKDAETSFTSVKSNSDRQEKPEADLPRAPKSLSSSVISSDLSSHKLGSLAAMKKRPCTTIEKLSPERKRYVFLSSSPTPGDRDSTNILPKDKAESLSKAATQVTQVPPILVVQARAATTMHTTTMSIVQQGGSMTNKRTLGVKRSMAGWEDRKHK